MRSKCFTLLVLGCAALLGCGSNPPIDLTRATGDTLAENLINANRYIALSEEQQIESYLARRSWVADHQVGRTRVVIAEKGKGEQLQYHERVAVSYSVSTLGGQLVYAMQPDTLTVGRREPTAGLDAALMVLRHGSKACVIVPPEEAYGVVGDADRIVSRMTLVYQLEVE